jgi:hypothetical protein
MLSSSCMCYTVRGYCSWQCDDFARINQNIGAEEEAAQAPSVNCPAVEDYCFAEYPTQKEFDCTWKKTVYLEPVAKRQLVLQLAPNINSVMRHVKI